MQICPSTLIFYIKEMRCPYQRQVYVFESDLSKNHGRNRVGKLHLDPTEAKTPSAQGVGRHTQCQHRGPQAGLPSGLANKCFKARHKLRGSRRSEYFSLSMCCVWWLTVWPSYFY